MSNAAVALTQNRSGIGFGTALRLLAIALGMMSALALARDGLGFLLLPYLDTVVTAYGIFFDDLFRDLVLEVFEPLFALLKNWFEWNLNLYPHWKHAFVLLWLLFGSMARVSPDAIWRFIRISLGALFALPFAVFAGLVPLSHFGVFWWSGAGFFLYHALADSTVDHQPGESRFSLSYWGLGLICIICGLAGITFGKLDWVSPGLVATVLLLGVWAIALVLMPIVPPRHQSDVRAQNVGLDVLSVLGGAAFIVWLGHVLA